MSYARFGEGSDVYIYSDGEQLNCCGCCLDGDFASDDFEKICEHLIRHLDAGHKVPRYCIERLFVEALNGEWGLPCFDLPVSIDLSGVDIVNLLRRTAALKEEEEEEECDF